MTNSSTRIVNRMPELYHDNVNNFKDKLDGVISLIGYDGEFMTSSSRDLVSYNGYNWLGGKTNQSNLDLLSRCNCCSRHQTYKPRRYERWDDSMAHPDSGGREIGGRWDQEDIDCHCECRHFARLICRMCDE